MADNGGYRLCVVHAVDETVQTKEEIVRCTSCCQRMIEWSI